MAKPVLAIDFDDVLFPFMQYFVPYCQEHFGLTHGIDDYYSFEFEEVWQCAKEESDGRVYEYVMGLTHTQLQPIDGAREAIEILAKDNELFVVSSREEAFRPATEEWLHAMFPGHFSHIHLCNHYSYDPNDVKRSKLEIMQDLGAYALIDDSLGHTAMVAAADKQAILFGDYAWNRCNALPEGVTRHHNWKSIIESLGKAA